MPKWERKWENVCPFLAMSQKFYFDLRGGILAGVASRPCLFCVGPQSRGRALAMPTAAGPRAGGATRWQFASASQRRPHAVNDARWRESKTPAERSVAKTASANARSGWWVAPPVIFSTIHFFAFAESGARRDGGRKAALCPARIGKGLPPSCCAECAAVV